MNQLIYSTSFLQHVRERLLVRRQEIAAFITSAFIFMILHKIMNVNVFPWDAGYYWHLGRPEHLFDFPLAIRGYFYPALLAPARYLSDTFTVLGYSPFRITSSLASSYFFTILLPAFYLRVFGGQVSFLRRLITPLLVAILFPGVIVYPLSDLPALAMMVCSSFCMLSSASTTSRLKRFTLLLLSGFLAYGAYNTRTIFLFPVALLALGTVFIIYHKHSIPNKISTILIFLSGAMVAAIPQATINLKHHDNLSPLVITSPPHSATTSPKQSLFVSQLFWGITLQRYETSVDKASPSAAVFYMDSAGERFFAENKIGNAPFEMSNYFKLLLQNPLDFLGIYGRHIVNGLDLRDGEIYTLGQPRDRNTLAIFNFLIIFSGLLIISMSIAAQRAKTGEKVKTAFWALTFLLPAIAIIPSAVETRFFLVLHLAFYCAIAFTSDLGLIKNLLRQHWLLIGAALGVSAILFFSVTTTTMTDPKYSYPALYRGNW
ncbi:hypothetical protein ALQ08_01102 [Pseudomonas syringae pv. delphinii]|uniref:Glycosyltransferase RgtA/B/C/D-like domain-containing protein n=1 Tax=Pseudomonas syringae pv. delphinii TaxID=192088 RepID=A0A0P9Q0A1_9PSED|nr:hypothetical protein [Pseudomonas syringae group genomosp. 3]KPX26523.1 Uncharacterized protein ALO72_03858 [Pseudomonas syringae pv. delphinii]RMP10791.1 hypothetical protein ALQ28_03572 [Pseudomonas syringae pv. delphinii]RMP21945.1 hypothetical protein ALQ27_03018 [Pseudomonas syringae pv. delphinii]RMQ22922.1 hypothetical protein ALQ08_01102 [Pseudomonas syringae pv. delphinii]